MSTPPSKGLRKAAAKHGQSEPEPEPAPQPEAASTREVPPAADSDPAGRLLGRLRDRESTGGRGAEAKSFAVGARVRVARGAFAGKSGVVQELDGRGGARVMLGLLSARIDLKDLVGETEPGGGGGGRDRLTLSSSHRKPR